MTRRYSIAAARSRLGAIVDQVDAGLDVELTRRGRPVAMVVSRRELDRLRGACEGFGEAYGRFLKRFSLDEIGVDRDFAGRRDAGSGRPVRL